MPINPGPTIPVPKEGDAGQKGPPAPAALPASELRFRRLFEAARDGILILDAATGRILEANPFMSELLGYDHLNFLGKELWEIGLFDDRAAYPAPRRCWRCPNSTPTWWCWTSGCRGWTATRWPGGCGRIRTSTGCG